MSVQIVEIKKADADQQIVYGEVYIPEVPDAHGEFMTSETIQKMAHEFLRNLRVHNIDTEHDNIENGSYVIESFIARKGDPDFIEGAWVVGVKIVDTEVWGKVRKGELNGFSIQAKVLKTPREVEVEVPEYVQGGTEDAADGHNHTFTVYFSEDGRFMGGSTDVVAGHSHDIKRGTVTELADDHSHRFAFVELWIEQ